MVRPQQTKYTARVNDIPSVHLWIYKKMRETYGLRIVRTILLIQLIRRTIYQPRTPKKLDYLLLNEMCEYGLLEKIDRLKCRILYKNCDAKLRKLEEYFFF